MVEFPILISEMLKRRSGNAAVVSVALCKSQSVASLVSHSACQSINIKFYTTLSSSPSPSFKPDNNFQPTLALLSIDDNIHILYG